MSQKQLAIIGNPVSHSFSPKMHNYISKKLGLDYFYSAIEVLDEDFDSAIENLTKNNFCGFNITAPYKVRIMDKVDVLSPEAKLFGSVNTCVNKNGKLYGYSTDAPGLYRSLIHEGIDITDKDILFIGAGGVTTPIMIHFFDKGAKSISIINRTIEKAQKISEYVEKVCKKKVNVGLDKSHYDIVINTTSVGMHPKTNQSPVYEIDYIDKNTAVIDLIYNPEKTLFLELCEKKGAKTVNGLGMLIGQGILSYELFTNTKLPDSIFDDIMKDVFNRK